jgi:hypothetical protein
MHSAILPRAVCRRQPVFFLLGLLLLALAPLSRAQSDVFTKWVQFFDPEGTGATLAAAMANDSEGNTIVVGSACVTDNCSDIESYTIKYDQNGNTLWRASLSGSGSGTDDTQNTGVKVAVDSANNIYVLSFLNANGTPDLALAKYSPSGARQWVGFFPGIDTAGTLAVAPNGDSYFSYNVAPNDEAYCNAYLNKVNTAGQQLWAHEINGQTNSICEHIPFIAFDASENVYALVYNHVNVQLDSSEIIKYNSSGTQLANFGALGIIGAFYVDATGNSYVAGGSGGAPPTGAENPIVAKYNSSGTLDWMYSYGAPYTPEGATGLQALVVDSAGDVFAAALIPNSVKYFLSKFTSTGTLDWTSNYAGGPGSGIPTINSVFISANSAGYSYFTATNPDSQLVTIKYDPQGSQVWQQSYNAPNGKSDSPVAIGGFGGDLIVVANGFSSSATQWITIDYVQDAAKVSPTSLTFGSQAEKTQSAPQSLTLTNTAEVAMTQISFDITGDFQLINNCPTSLAAGASCKVSVTFTPTATGTRTGAVTVHDDWAGSTTDPQTVKLTGTGVN